MVLYYIQVLKHNVLQITKQYYPIKMDTFPYIAYKWQSVPKTATGSSREALPAATACKRRAFPKTATGSSREALPAATACSQWLQLLAARTGCKCRSASFLQAAAVTLSD